MGLDLTAGILLLEFTQRVFSSSRIKSRVCTVEPVCFADTHSSGLLSLSTGTFDVQCHSACHVPSVSLPAPSS